MNRQSVLDKYASAGNGPRLDFAPSTRFNETPCRSPPAERVNPATIDKILSQTLSVPVSMGPRRSALK